MSRFSPERLQRIWARKTRFNKDFNLFHSTTASFDFQKSAVTVDVCLKGRCWKTFSNFSACVWFMCRSRKVLMSPDDDLCNLFLSPVSHQQTVDHGLRQPHEQQWEGGGWGGCSPVRPGDYSGGRKDVQHTGTTHSTSSHFIICTVVNTTDLVQVFFPPISLFELVYPVVEAWHAFVPLFLCCVVSKSPFISSVKQERKPTQTLHMDPGEGK